MQSQQFDPKSVVSEAELRNILSISDNTTDLKNKDTKDYLESNVFPNPADNELIITNAGEFNKIEIISILGQTLLSVHNDSDTVCVDISGLQSGVYVVKVYTKNNETKLLSEFVKK